MQKWYIVCGERRWVGYAASALLACMKMLSSTEGGAPFGEVCFCDERGFRTNELGPFGIAQGWFTTNQVYMYMQNLGGCDDNCEGI
jgi:uncharacterized membrane protein